MCDSEGLFPAAFVLGILRDHPLRPSFRAPRFLHYNEKSVSPLTPIRKQRRYFVQPRVVLLRVFRPVHHADLLDTINVVAPRRCAANRTQQPLGRRRRANWRKWTLKFTKLKAKSSLSLLRGRVSSKPSHTLLRQHLDPTGMPTRRRRRRRNTMSPFHPLNVIDRPSVHRPRSCASGRREAADPVPTLGVTFLTKLDENPVWRYVGCYGKILLYFSYIDL
jgi:hypothetical protein